MRKLIAIQVGNEAANYELELKFTYKFIEFVKRITNNPTIELFEVSKGSLKSLLHIDLRSYAELMEKIIFIIQESKRKKIQNLMMSAKVERNVLEKKIRANEATLKQAGELLDLFERAKKLGVNIQMDDELIISQTSEGMEIKEPKLLLNMQRLD